MKKPIITPEQVDDMKNLLGFAACALDNLYVGLQEYRQGIIGIEECFTKRDLKTIEKATDLIQDIRWAFDGTRKQRGKKHV